MNGSLSLKKITNIFSQLEHIQSISLRHCYLQPTCHVCHPYSQLFNHLFSQVQWEVNYGKIQIIKINIDEIVKIIIFPIVIVFSICEFLSYNKELSTIIIFMMNAALIEQQKLQQQVHSQNLTNYCNLIHQPQPISEQMDWNKSPSSSNDNRHVNFYFYYHFFMLSPQPTNKQTKKNPASLITL